LSGGAVPTAGGRRGAAASTGRREDDMSDSPRPRLMSLRAGALVSGTRAGVARAAVTGVAVAGLLGLAVVPASPAQARATASAVPSSQTTASAAHPAIRPFNVGQPHSPQLLRQLAGAPPARRLAAGQSPLVGSAPWAATGPTAGPIAGAVQGVDVASYQEQNGINWAKTAAAGIQFAAIKVSEGTYYANPFASADLTAAKAAGLSVMAYAFAIPDGYLGSPSPVAQADYFLARATAPGGQAPEIMLDIEYDPYKSEDGTNNCYGLSTSAMSTWISRFGAEISAKTGRLPIIYTTQDWWATCTGSSTAFSQYPLWVASYTSASSPGPLPAGWPSWNLWQYTSTGTVPGIPDTGHTDLDQLNPAALTILDPGSQQTKVRSAVALRLRASMPGLDFSATGLPPGLTLNSSTGRVTGTASATGSYPVTITATNPVSSAAASASFTWLVHGTLAITPPASRSATAGRPADFRVRTADSVAGQVPVLAAAGLPVGVAISPAGQVTGWPDRPGRYQVKVSGRDSLGATATASFAWTVRMAADTGPAGQVTSDLAGACLTDVSNRTASGTRAEAAPCRGTAAQRWTYVPDGTLRIHGKCLAVPGTAAASGAKVALAACTGGSHQQWRPVYPRALSPSLGASPTTLRNPWSKLCLADRARATGTLMVAATCAGTAGQSWTLPAGPIQSEVPGKCITDSGDKITAGNKIEISTCDGAAAQRWTVHPDGTVRIRGRCLGVASPGTASGQLVGLYACDSASTQLWHLIPAGTGLLLQNPESGLCLTDPEAATANGTRLVIAACVATPGKNWHEA
jgi:GH25 family lysozyme M1 (1,4-beta-N-acetylmuramidase)